MLHLALTEAWAHKRRLLGTSLSIVLGVAFLVATLVLGDSASAGFESAFTRANVGTDAYVRNATDLGSDEAMSSRAPIPIDVLDAVRATDGVVDATPQVMAAAQLLGADGEPLGGEGPPTLGASWIGDPEVDGYSLASGRAPAGPGEIVIDEESARLGELDVGDHTTVLTPAPVEAQVVGIAEFGDDESLAGVTLAAFDLPEAQRLFLGDTSEVSGVIVQAADGVSQDDLVARLDRALPDGVSAISGADLTAEQQAQIEGDFLGFLSTALLVFACIALLVASFSIFNTFSILAAQRTREAALLRSLGASRRQVLVAGLVESVVVGLVGAATGIAAGLGLANGLVALLDSAGFGLPIDRLVVDGGDLVRAAVVGIAVSAVAGVLPAWRGARVAPLAALREVAVDTSGASRGRLLTGTAVAAAGVTVVLVGSAGGNVPLAGLGALLVVIGVVLVGPVAVGPVGKVLGAPLRLRGVPGDLAGRNARRNPRRTASTAASLLVGVGVVSLFTVFGASVSRTIEDAVDRGFAGDLVVTAGGFSGVGLGTDLRDAVADLPEIATVAGIGWGPASLDGEDREVGYADLAALDRVADLRVVTGSLADAGPGTVTVAQRLADDEGWAVGDTITLGFGDGATEPATLVATYDDRYIGGDVLLAEPTWAAHVPVVAYQLLLTDLADGVSIDDGRRALEGVATTHGGPEVKDREEFVDDEASEVAALLTVIYALLAIAIVIALMGIANTLSLSIHERRRELGLLRAVGVTRGQVRSMVRWESVLVAAFGSLGGIAVGIFLGWGLVRAMHAAEGLGTFVLPISSLVTVGLLGAAAGVLAGLRPALRASRLDVLEAVSS